MIKYYRCNKCGLSLTTDETGVKASMCILNSIPGRYICGGGYTEITKEEYDNQIKEWLAQNKNNII